MNLEGAPAAIMVAAAMLLETTLRPNHPRYSARFAGKRCTGPCIPILCLRAKVAAEG